MANTKQLVCDDRRIAIGADTLHPFKLGAQRLPPQIENLLRFSDSQVVDEPIEHGARLGGARPVAARGSQQTADPAATIARRPLDRHGETDRSAATNTLVTSACVVAG